MKLKKSAFASIVCITGGCLGNQAAADAIRNVGAPVILDAFADANPDIGTGTLSIALGSGNYNLPNSGNGNNSGRGLIIGEGNTLSTPNSHVAGYAMVTGYGNSIRVHGGIVGGYNNRISFDQSSTTNFGKFTSIFGISNIVHSGVQGAYASLVAGSQQRLTGDYSFLSGQENIVSGPSIGSEALNSVAMGATNTIASETAWTIGAENILSGKEASAYGTGLSAIHRGVTVLGSYNSDPMVTGAGSLDLRTNYFSGSPLLVVGNGTATNARSNALVLRRSGDLEIGGNVFASGSKLATESYSSSAATAAINSKFSGALAMTGGTAFGVSSIAMSDGYASGVKSIAMTGGYSSGTSSTAISRGRALGAGSTAIADGWASGAYSVSLGGGNAQGDYSFAIGGNAEGMGSLAMGGHSLGDYSVTIGGSNYAYAHKSMVVGHGGIANGAPNDWYETDTVFAVGNSPFVETEYPPIYGYSNAITTLKNGQTILTNKFWDTEFPTVVPSNPDESSGNALIVEGHTILEGNSRLKGNTVMEGQVSITQAQGDISMGIYQ